MAYTVQSIYKLYKERKVSSQLIIKTFVAVSLCLKWETDLKKIKNNDRTYLKSINNTQNYQILQNMRKNHVIQDAEHVFDDMQVSCTHLQNTGLVKTGPCAVFTLNVLQII
ncbi:Hypothetical_protein [Hexamita inflata]|uniref:Hypothetical_protein n=1 Tax=Hexamita inflata TaxID=28002 RepID=A0AA86U0W5_9EUKA|nr:Hypothetical protein HINF_LOCUS23669 [Hexamita inflata]